MSFHVLPTKPAFLLVDVWHCLEVGGCACRLIFGHSLTLVCPSGRWADEAVSCTVYKMCKILHEVEESFSGRLGCSRLRTAFSFVPHMPNEFHMLQFHAALSHVTKSSWSVRFLHHDADSKIILLSVCFDVIVRCKYTNSFVSFPTGELEHYDQPTITCNGCYLVQDWELHLTDEEATVALKRSVGFVFSFNVAKTLLCRPKPLFYIFR